LEAPIFAWQPRLVFIGKPEHRQNLCKEHNENTIEKQEHLEVRHNLSNHGNNIAQLLKDSKEEECLNYLRQNNDSHQDLGNEFSVQPSALNEDIGDAAGDVDHIEVVIYV